MNSRSILLLSVALLTGPTLAHAVTLHIDGNGILTGASDVNVGGVLYDVQFLDGSCISLFAGCDNAVDDFAFATEADALIAGQALLDQVFTDTSMGQFDSVVALTNGCTNSIFGACGVDFPYALGDRDGTRVVDIVEVVNFFVEPDRVVAFPGLPDFETTSPAFTFAVWTPVSVREPGSLALLGLGLLGLGLTRRNTNC